MIHLRVVDDNIGFTRELEIGYKKGELVKKNWIYQEFADWKDNNFKILHFREDTLNDTRQVIKEEIYNNNITIVPIEEGDDLLSELDTM